jgi:hypothetical protein
MKLGVLNFELQKALEVSRNLGLLQSYLPWVQKRAVQTLRRRLPVEARRDIQAEYDIQAARVRQDIGTREIPDGLRLTGYFRGIGLRNFRARQTRRGVTAAPFRGRRTLREGSFFAGLNSGNKQVVRREGPKRKMTAGRYIGQMRQPLVVEYGPSVAQMLRKGRRPERLADYAAGVLRSEVERLLAYYEGGRPLPSTGEMK